MKDNVVIEKNQISMNCNFHCKVKVRFQDDDCPWRRMPAKIDFFLQKKIVYGFEENMFFQFKPNPFYDYWYNSFFYSESASMSRIVWNGLKLS